VIDDLMVSKAGEIIDPAEARPVGRWSAASQGERLGRAYSSCDPRHFSRF
jgi:hypothetical protein